MSLNPMSSINNSTNVTMSVSLTKNMNDNAPRTTPLHLGRTKFTPNIISRKAVNEKSLMITPTSTTTTFRILTTTTTKNQPKNRNSSSAITMGQNK